MDVKTFMTLSQGLYWIFYSYFWGYCHFGTCHSLNCHFGNCHFRNCHFGICHFGTCHFGNVILELVILELVILELVILKICHLGNCQGIVRNCKRCKAFFRSNKALLIISQCVSLLKHMFPSLMLSGKATILLQLFYYP